MEENSLDDREGLLQNDSLNSNLLMSGSTDILTSGEVSTSIEVNRNFTRYSIEQSVEEPPPPPSTVYRRRWYILITFCLVSSTQAAVWATWGPIATSTKLAFGWSDHTTALLANWGAITYVIGAPFFVWLIGKSGLRVATLVTGGLVVIGTGLRCVTSHPPLVTSLTHVGQLLNGFAGPVSFGASTVVSSTWFPVSQRTTATALISICYGFGAGTPYIIGPLVVPSNTTENSVEEIRKSIMYMNYGFFGWSAFLFLVTLIYFPSKPPTPPSISASMERLDFKSGIKRLVRNKKLWILCLCLAIPTGFQGGLGSVLEVDLSSIGVSQLDAGWLGFSASVSANAFTLLLGFFSDIFKRRMKLLVIASYTTGLIGFAVFIGVYIKLIPYNPTILWVSYIISVIGIWAPSPLFFELAAEVNYPVSEGLSNGFITWLMNVVVAMFLFVLMAPSVSTVWINWSLLGSLVVAIPIMFFFKENYSRLDIDTQEQPHIGYKNIQDVPAYLHGDVTPHPLYTFRWQ